MKIIINDRMQYVIKPSLPNVVTVCRMKIHGLAKIFLYKFATVTRYTFVSFKIAKTDVPYDLLRLASNMHAF